MTTLHGKEINIGDKVWDFLNGWDEVVTIDETRNYPIETHRAAFIDNGFDLKEHKFPRLFWQEFEIPEKAFEKPKTKVKKYIVLYKYNENYVSTSVWNEGYYLSKEQFYKENSGLPYKFISLIMESEIEVEE